MILGSGLHTPVKYYPDPLNLPELFAKSRFWADTAYNWVLQCKLNLAFCAICKVTTSKFTAKLLLLSHSENYIKLTFVVVSHKIFLVMLFCTHLPAPSAPLSYATDPSAVFLRATTSAMTNTHLRLLLLFGDFGTNVHYTYCNQTSLAVFQQRLPTAATQWRIWMTRYSFCMGRPTPASRDGSLRDSTQLSRFLWSHYVIAQTIIVLPCDLYLFLSFFSSPNLSGRRLNVYHTSTHGVALVRI